MPRRTATSAVLLREAQRAARRPSTWLLRVLFTGAIVLLVLSMWDTGFEREHDVAQLAVQGRQLFIAYVWLQAVAVAILAPLQVASGLIEERDDNTLDLLVLTRLTPARILTGKALSRLLQILTVVLGGLPLLAMVMTLGGVSSLEVVNATVSTLVLGLVLGALGGFHALHAKTPIGPALGALSYLFPGMILLPLCYAIVRGSSSNQAMLEAMSQVSPLFALSSSLPSSVAIVAIFSPVLVTIVALAMPVFRIVTTEDQLDDELGLLSPDVWVVERFKRRAGLGVIAVVAGLVAMVFVAAAHAEGWISIHLYHLLAFGYTVLMAVEGTALWLLLSLWLSRRIAKHAQATRVPKATAGRSARTIWFNPVLWRELATRTGGSGRSLVLAGTALWASILLLFVLAGGNSKDLRYFVYFSGCVGASVVVSLLTTGTLIEERHRRTLPLLLTTTLSVRQILWGKLLASLLRASPLVAIAAAVWLFLEHQPYPVHGAIGLLWLLLVLSLQTLLQIGVCLRAPSIRSIWPISILGFMLFWSWPVLIIMLDDMLTLRLFDKDLLELWIPFLDNQWRHRHITASALGSLALWGTALVVTWAVLRLRFRPWVLRLGR